MGSPAVSGSVTLIVGFGGVPVVHSGTGTTAHPPTMLSGETVIHSLTIGLPVEHLKRPADFVSGPVTGRNHRPNRVTMSVADSLMVVSAPKPRPLYAFGRSPSPVVPATTPSTNVSLAKLPGEVEHRTVSTKATIATAPPTAGPSMTTGTPGGYVAPSENPVHKKVLPAGGTLMAPSAPAAVGPLP